MDLPHMKKPYLKKIYRFDNLKEAYIIDIDLDYYQEIFAQNLP